MTHDLPPEVVIPRALTTITAVWAETLDPPRAPDGGGGSVKAESKSPLPDGALEARREAKAVLGSWVAFVVAERGLCGRMHRQGRHREGELCLRRTDDVVSQDGDGLAVWLGQHVTWLAGHELGPVCALELDEQDKALDRLAHPDRPDALFIGQCPVQIVPGGPSCGRRLYWPTGALTMQCPSCTVTDDVDGWLQRMGDDLPDELTAAQLATYLTRKLRREISHELVRKWVSRKTLRSTGAQDERGRPLYSAVASVALAEEQISQSQRPPRRVA